MVALELPPPVEEKLRAKAAQAGMSLEQYLVKVAEREVDPAPPRTPLRGRLAGTGSDLSLEEFQQARREAWVNFPREAPSPEQP
jgi:hypothetical protein